MGVIRQLKQVVIAEPNSGEQSTAPATDDESVTSGQATPVPAPNLRTRNTSAISPALVRRELGYKLRMKQGRRTKQRCENEKMLMTMYGIDAEDAMGEDIAQETKSYFLDLMNMENDVLLDQFINNEEPRYFSKEKITRKVKKVTAENFEPEEAFLKIGFNMRQALKKHPPMGMLEGIEDKINETFTTNANSEFVAEDMSSFERLLLHALCAYNSLNSHSFDFGGKRIVRVENPYATFFLKTPGLCSYLRSRFQREN